MQPTPPLSRRQFLAASTGALLTAQISPRSDDRAAKLALHGGEKMVKDAPPKLVRWGAKERERLTAMLDQDSLFYWRGPQTAAFIERFRKFCPLPHVMSCSSGTAALHIAVAAAGLAPGDEVITSPITDIGTVIGVIYQQAVPVFADLDANSYNLDVEDVRRRLTPKTKAIIAVHLGGNPCDLQALQSIAREKGLVLIEDCAQAWGALYQNHPIGTAGDFACFSLQNSKQVTCGDGGVVASAHEKFGPLLQRFGDKGFDRLGRTGLFESFSTNYRMSEPQAAVAAAQLERLDHIATRRAALGNLLSAELAGLPGVSPHAVRAGDRCTYWFYMFRIRTDELKCDRAEFVKALAAEGAPASAGYIPVLLFKNPVFLKHGFFAGHWPVKEMGLTRMDYRQVECPAAEAILQTGVRIVLHEAMTEEYVRSLAAAIRKVARFYAS